MSQFSEQQLKALAAWPGFSESLWHRISVRYVCPARIYCTCVYNSTIFYTMYMFISSLLRPSSIVWESNLVFLQIVSKTSGSFSKHCVSPQNLLFWTTHKKRMKTTSVWKIKGCPWHPYSLHSKLKFQPGLLAPRHQVSSQHLVFPSPNQTRVYHPGLHSKPCVFIRTSGFSQNSLFWWSLRYAHAGPR